MANSSDSTPNFDWLKAATEGVEEGPRLSASANTDDAVSDEAPGVEESTPPDDAEADQGESSSLFEDQPTDGSLWEPDEVDAESVFDNLDEVPPPVENMSEGETLVLHHDHPPATFQPGPEDFAADAEAAAPQDAAPVDSSADKIPSEHSEASSEPDNAETESLPPAAESTPMFLNAFAAQTDEPKEDPPAAPEVSASESNDEQPEATTAEQDSADAPEPNAADAAHAPTVIDAGGAFPGTMAEQDSSPDFNFLGPVDTMVHGDQSKQNRPVDTLVHGDQSKQHGPPPAAAVSDSAPENQSTVVFPEETFSKASTKPNPSPTSQSAPPEATSAPLSTPPGDQPNETASATKPATPPPHSEPKKTSEHPAETTGKSNLLLIILASYASLVTLLLIMSMMRKDDKPHQLESLPDVAPEAETNLTYVPLNAPLPWGHTLAVGESQRFGNLKVEVLRISREPIEFVHYSGDASRQREPTAPVYKLWLRFTNVSSEQQFAPLDRDLTLRWIVKAEQQREYSNYYIFPEGESDPTAPTQQMYRLSKESDWDMKGQNLGQILEPGASTETYLATNADDEISLTGRLVWRFQVRKGLSPSGNGVTTMVEVPFDTNDV